MYTLKQLIDKAYQELLDSGLSEKTVYGANWYIWNRLVRIYGEDEIFNEDMCFKYCESYFGRNIFNIDIIFGFPIQLYFPHSAEGKYHAIIIRLSVSLTTI